MKTKSCPDCNATLNAQAKSCNCGWQEESLFFGKPKAGDGYIEREPFCTFRANGKKCRFPVGFFDTGATTGFCIFHRGGMSLSVGANIVEMSQNSNRGVYLDLIKDRRADPENWAA